MSDYDYTSEDLARQMRRQRERERRRRKMLVRRRRMRILLAAGILLIIILAVIVRHIVVVRTAKTDPVMDEKVETEETENRIEGEEQDGQNLISPENDPENIVSDDMLDQDVEAVSEETDTEEVETESYHEHIYDKDGYKALLTESTETIVSEDVQSSHAILIDLDNSTIVAHKSAYDRIVPASMTKILTVLVAAEHITDLNDIFTITREITDYSYRNDGSSAGFLDGETVTVEDLLYGTILPSGADAAAGLAYYVSGSLDGFVDLMNEKIAELGLSNSAHFTNCVGFYNENHYCTPYDMAIILKAAMENSLCQEVMSAHIYTTSSTAQHPQGIELSNWFLRRIEDKDTNGEVVCAKTGYVVQSGNCGASYFVSSSGKRYICVTADAHSAWRCIYDHVAIYQQYTE